MYCTLRYLRCLGKKSAQTPLAPKKSKPTITSILGNRNLMGILNRAYGTVVVLGVRKRQFKTMHDYYPRFPKKSEQKNRKGVFTVCV